MSERISKQSPLWYVSARPGPSIAPATAIRYFENGLRAHINLRGDPADVRFAGAAERVLGAALPTAANTTRVAGDIVVYWLGPDEWLAVAPGEREHEIVDAFRAALDGVHSSVTPVTGGQTILVLRGAHVRDLLAKGCPFDLHSPAFRAGACAQTHLAKAGVLLRPLGEEGIEIVVRRSFADYLYKWLETAAAEYGWMHATGDPPGVRELLASAEKTVT
jgi:heterotetrameric sarcosine oxidase gamma subunit